MIHIGKNGPGQWASAIAVAMCSCLLLASEVHAADELPVELPDELTAEEVQFFESKIRPVLIQECYGCHSNDSGNASGGLRLDTQALTHIGGASGPAVVPGDLDESLLLSAIEYEGYEMPPRRQLPESIIQDFRTWIAMGAPDPRVNEISEFRSAISVEDIAQARESFWAYQPVSDVAIPFADNSEVSSSRWVKSEIDAFVLAELEANDMRPTGDAEPYKILRRLYFDLIGLPPSPEEVSRFEKDYRRNPDMAIDAVADQLLASSQFGERWGRHWLDVARYGESTGREVNMTYPHAWRYRDFVIDSFNDDKPFNHFVQQQIAGDLLPAASDEEWAENLIATTFLAVGPKNVSEQNRTQFQMDVIDEQIDATTRVFLATSVACARCHDHKFEPIPQSDYYAMAGIFGNTTTYYGNPPSEYGTFRLPQLRQTSSLLRLPVDDPNPYDKRYSSSELEELHAKIRSTQQQSTSRPRGDGEDAAAALRQRLLNLNRLADLSNELAVVDDRGQPISYTMGVQDRDEFRDAELLIRGEIDQAAQTVPRGLPKVFCGDEVEIPSDQSGRLQLARWIGSEDSPLTSRVMVNRVWTHLIGRGLVASVDDFGSTGSEPSHPELLDYLAKSFVDSNWSTKRLIKSIVTSRIYRMNSEFHSGHHERDPDNALLWRANPRRLDAESIRDAMLAISGELDIDRPRGSEVAKAGYSRVRNGLLGDPRAKAEKAMATVREEVMQAARQRMADARSGAGRNMRERFQRNRAGGQTSDSDRRRGNFRPDEQMRGMIAAKVSRKIQNELDMEDATFRSVYLPIIRDESPRSLEVFDGADPNASISQRESSNTANQALFMLNNPLVVKRSEAMARRLAYDAQSAQEQIKLAFQLCYGREPRREELKAVSDFADAFRRESTGDSPQVNMLALFCQSLFASSEFRLID